jgi:type I restriction enzyme S subunit
MSEQVNSRCIVARWADLRQWDLKNAKAAASRRLNPHFVPFGEFAEESTDLVRPWEAPAAEWPVYGVNNETGVFFSHYQRGDEFNAAYKRIERDWFFHNPTRANVGSLGRVPEVQQNAITSPEYQVWRMKSGRMIPSFAEILIRTPYFLDQVAVHRVGAVKERLFVQNLLQIPVPDLPMHRQQEIVARRAVLLAKERELLLEIQRREAALRSMFLSQLGLQAPEVGTPPKVLSVQFSGISRWAVDFNQSALQRADPGSGHYPVVHLRDVIADLENGWSPKCLDRPADLGEWGVLKMGAVSFGSFNERENKALPSDLLPQKSLEVRRGDLLISRANITRLVGACALIYDTRPGLMLCDKIFRVVWQAPSAVEPAFLDEILKVPHLRQQIEGAVTGGSPTMKNITKPALLNLRLPLPPLEVQQKIMADVHKARARLVELQRALAALREETTTELQGMIIEA